MNGNWIVVGQMWIHKHITIAIWWHSDLITVCGVMFEQCKWGGTLCVAAPICVTFGGGHNVCCTNATCTNKGVRTHFCVNNLDCRRVNNNLHVWWYVWCRVGDVCQVCVSGAQCASKCIAWCWSAVYAINTNVEVGCGCVSGLCSICCLPYVLNNTSH